jgi:hypothetical protein
MRQALADDHPLSLLALASSLLAVVDPRRKSPMERALDEDTVELTREELVRSFLEADIPRPRRCSPSSLPWATTNSKRPVSTGNFIPAGTPFRRGSSAWRTSTRTAPSR